MRAFAFTFATIALCGATFTSAALAETVYAITEAGSLITFDSATPGAILTGVPVSGLASNEELQGIDFRPATGELFGVGSFSTLYRIDPGSGAATPVAGSFSPGLNGAWFGFDFNPTIDRIRNVSDANQNLVLNPNSGTSTGVTNLFYGPGDLNEGLDPTIAHSAYTNNFNGATTSQLYGIDVSLNVLVTQANSAGTLGTVGSLGFDPGSSGGFDVSGLTGTAFAALMPESSSTSMLYTINLSNGQASLIGEIAGGLTVTAMTLAPVPEPTALALLSLGALGLLRTKRS